MSTSTDDLAAMLSALSPEALTAFMNTHRAGLDRVLGLEYTRVGHDRVEATVRITETHLQPYGLVHGGVYAAIVESVCSLGAALPALAQGRNVVGLENTTRFVRGTRAGATLHAVAVPAPSPEPGRARWDATISETPGEVCATGRLTMAVLDADATVGGTTIAPPAVVLPENPT